MLGKLYVKTLQLEEKQTLKIKLVEQTKDWPNNC